MFAGKKKLDPPTRRTGMVFTNRQAGRRVKKPGQTRGQRQEREEGWMAEGQAARGFVRNPFSAFPDRPGGVPGGEGNQAPGHCVIPRFCANRFFGKFSALMQIDGDGQICIFMLLA